MKKGIRMLALCLAMIMLTAIPTCATGSGINI